jgi:hypothetical protein
MIARLQMRIFPANELLLETEFQQALAHHFETHHLLRPLDGAKLVILANMTAHPIQIVSQGTCWTPPVGLKEKDSFGRKGKHLLLKHHLMIRPILLL